MRHYDLLSGDKGQFNSAAATKHSLIEDEPEEKIPHAASIIGSEDEEGQTLWQMEDWWKARGPEKTTGGIRRYRQWLTNLQLTLTLTSGVRAGEVFH
ncbi:MAG: hypothetical protein M3N93_12775, partial [Acidobacteriota bacterium]|nr:hypothetical protein [Acidobacteriota bacterium]